MAARNAAYDFSMFEPNGSLKLRKVNRKNKI